MIELKKCICGNDALIQMIPQVSNKSEFRIDSVGATVRPANKTVPVFWCINCGRLEIPASSFPGRNRLDTDVRAYEVLLNAVKANNNRIDLLAQLAKERVVNNKVLEEIKERLGKIEVGLTNSAKTTKEPSGKQTRNGSKASTKPNSK